MRKYALVKMKEALPQATASLVASFFAFCFGSMLTYPAILIGQMQNIKNATVDDEDSWPISNVQASWIASVGVLSSFVISILLTFVVDRVGRLSCMRVMIVPFIFGNIVMANSTGIDMILAGEAIALGSSVCFPILTAVYIAEISSPALRGSLLNYKPVLISFGMFLTYLKGKYLHWRIIPYIISAYASAALLLSKFIPESEAWLTATRDSAKKQFDAFRKPTFYKPLFIITGFYLFQNLAGTNVTILNLVSFFHDFETEYDPYSVSIYVGLSKFLVNLINTWSMIHFNRRSLITFSFLGMALATGASATSTMLVNEGGATYQWISPMMLVAYTIFSNLGVMFMPYLVSSELWPSSVRASAQSISFAISQFVIFASFQFYYFAKTYATSWQIQYFFGFMSFAGLLYGYYVLPETHNKTLTEIEDRFCDVVKKNEI